MYDGLMESLCEHSMRIESAHVSGNIAPLKIITKNTGFHMKRIYLLCLMLCLAACGSETDTSLGMNNQPPSIEIKEHVAYRYTVVLANASDDAIITINDLPNWAEFDPETNIISGVPGHDNAGAEFTFSINAADGEETFQSNDVTLSVKHSDLAIQPILQARTSINELFSYKRDVVVESDISQLSFSLINAPEWMVISESAGVISGIPTHKTMGEDHVDIQYSDIVVSVTDGSHTVLSDPFDVLVKPNLDLSPLINIAGTNLSEDFKFNQNIIISFDSVIDVTSISVDAVSGACTSNILISSDDFVTCVQPTADYVDPVYNYADDDPNLTDEENQQIKDVETERADKEARESNQLVLSTERLEVNTNYKLLITSHAVDGFEYSLEEDYQEEFFTLQ
jgi:hypothetical protein